MASMRPPGFFESLPRTYLPLKSPLASGLQGVMPMPSARAAGTWVRVELQLSSNNSKPIFAGSALDPIGGGIEARGAVSGGKLASGTLDFGVMTRTHW